MTVNSNVSKNSASVDQQTIQDLSSTGRHQECLEACQKLLQSEAESPMAWKYAGKSLIALGQMENAQQCLKKAHQIAKSDPEIAKDIGNIFLILGRREDATAWYRKSLEIKNDYVPAIVKLANIKKQSGNNQEAANLYNQAIQTDPTLVEAYVGAAACTMALGNLDQAQTIATQAIGINQSIEGVNEILGVIYQNKRNFQQAIASYQKELDINPKSETSLLNLGLLLLQQGESAAAIKPLTRAAAINPSEQCSLLLAQAYQSVGNQKEAICEYQKIDFSKIQNKMIPFNLGLCLLNTGRNIDAIEAFKIAIKLDESFLPAWGNIGTAFMKEGRYQEALPVTQKVIEHDPNNPTAHMNLGGIYKDLGNLDQALASTLKSLELNPANPDALNNLSCIYQDLGNLDQAFASTLKSLELKPFNNLCAYDNLTLNLQCQRKKRDIAPSNLIEAIDAKLRKMEIPGSHKSIIYTHEIDRFVRKALDISSPLEAALTTSLTQIFHRTRNIEPNCKSLTAFFEQHNSIAHKCHSCYKLQIEVSTLDELITLNFLMKTLRLEPNNTRKCMVELRENSTGFYKGLIYCTTVDEAENVAKQTKKHISENSYMSPTLKVKRGCTEFTNAHKSYGEIGDLDNLNQGAKQRKEWKTNEEQFFSSKTNTTTANIMGLEFNLGELLIMKNWILYALAMGDSAAIAKYENIRYKNKIISEAIELKKNSLERKYTG